MARPNTAAVRLLAGEREPVRVATTANIPLSGLQTVDGVALVAGERVLVKDQNDAIYNGIYEASSGVWYRAGDARQSRTINKGTTVRVQSGTTNGGKGYEFVTLNPVIGTDDIVLELSFSVATIESYIAEIEIFVRAAQDAADAAASSTLVGDPATITNLQAATIPVGKLFVRVGGYAAPGDGGHSLMKRVAAEPSHSGKARSADRFMPDGTTNSTQGGWWEIADSPMRPQQFGAVSSLSSGTDNSVALQACIDTATVLRRTVELRGHFNLDNTVNIKGAVDIVGDQQYNLFSNDNIPMLCYRPDLGGGPIEGGSVREVCFFSENVGTRTNEAAIKVQDLTNAGGVNHHRFSGNVFRGNYRAFWTAVANDSPGQWNTISDNRGLNQGGIFTDIWAYFEGSNFGGSVVSNNVITGLTCGIKAGNGTASVGDFTITDNQFNTCPIGVDLTGGPAYGYNVKLIGNQWDAGVVTGFKLTTMDGITAYANDFTGGGDIQSVGALGKDCVIERNRTIPATLTANTNNFDALSLSLARVLVLSATGSYSMTGVVTQGDARELIIFNESVYTILLVHESTSSAGFRFQLPGAVDYSLLPNSVIRLFYVPGVNRWFKMV